MDPFQGLDFQKEILLSEILQIHIIFILLALRSCIGLPRGLQHSFAVYVGILFEHYFEVQII